jgi:hypothetical protein
LEFSGVDFGHRATILESAMPVRPTTRISDAKELAHRIMQGSTEQAPKTKPPGVAVKNPTAWALGRLGMLGGGVAMAEPGPTKRSRIAAKAADARWGQGK